VFSKKALRRLGLPELSLHEAAQLQVEQGIFIALIVCDRSIVALMYLVLPLCLELVQ
jgi:hypothetical protein